MDKGLKRRIVRLKERIEGTLTVSDWETLAMMTDQEKIVHGDSRLLQSLKFSDDDYGSRVLTVLQKIAEADESALDEIEKYLAKRYPAIQGEIWDDDEDQQMPTLTIAPTVFKVPKGGVDDRLVSVMMPFDAAFNSVYKAIRRAVVDNHGMRCERADAIWKHETVIQDIFDLIYTSRLVIVDFTGRNPNVMYETGIAHTLGKSVIPIVQSSADVPFDTQHIRYLKYLANGEGLKTLSQKLTLRMNTILS
jgi:hypothetical protein